MVTLELRKWPDRARNRFTAIRLGDDEHGTWLGVEAGSGWIYEGRPAKTAVGWAILLPPDGWWVAFFMDRTARHRSYVHVSTPPRWLTPAHAVAIDLDLDVLHRWDGDVRLVDGDEFEQHRVAFAYPDDVVAEARRCAADIVEACTTGREPFGDAAQRWLATLG